MADDWDDPISFLETHRNTLVDFINADFFVDKLRSQHSLSIDDAQEIQNGHGKRNKVRIFLDVLRTKGKKGFDIFMTYLELEYSEVFEKITGKKANVPDDYVPQHQSRMSVLLPHMSEMLNELVKQHAEKKDLTGQLEKLKVLVEYDKAYKKDLEVEVGRLQEQDINIKQLRQDNIRLINAEGQLLRIRGDLATQSLQFKIEFDQERCKNRDLQHKTDSLQKALTETQEKLDAAQEGNRSSKEDSGVDVNIVDLDGVQHLNDGGIPTEGKHEATQQEIFESDLQELRQSNEFIAIRLTKAEEDLCTAEGACRLMNQELLACKGTNLKLKEELGAAQASKRLYYKQLENATECTQNLIEERKREQARYEAIVKQKSQLQESFFHLENGNLENTDTSCNLHETHRPRARNVQSSDARIAQEKRSEYLSANTPDNAESFKRFESFPSLDDDKEAAVESPGEQESMILRMRRLTRTDTERVNLPLSLRFSNRNRDLEEEGNNMEILQRAAALKDYPSPGQESEESSTSKYGTKSPVVGNKYQWMYMKSPSVSDTSESFKSLTPSDAALNLKRSRFYDESPQQSFGSYTCSNELQFVKVKRSSSELSERSDNKSGEMKIEVSCRHFRRTLEIEGGNRTGHFVKHIDASSLLKYGDQIVKLHLLSENGLYDLKYSFIDITAEEAAQIIQSCAYRLDESLCVYVRRDQQAHEAYKAFIKNNTKSCGDCFYVTCNFSFSPLNNDADALSFNKDDILEVVNTVSSKSDWLATNCSQNQRSSCTDVKYGTIPNTHHASKLFRRKNSRTLEATPEGGRGNFNRVAVRGQKRSNSLPYERVEPIRGESE